MEIQLTFSNAVSGVLLLAVTTFLRRLLRKKRQIKQAIFNQKRGLDASVHSLEEERRLLSREIHNISANWSPLVPERPGLKAALEEYSSLDSNSACIMIDVRSSLHEQFEPFLKLNLYRISPELVHNPIKHAKAGYIQILSEKENSNLKPEVRDNEKGLQERDSSEYLATSRKGVENIQHRLFLIQGSIGPSPVRSPGCHIQIDVPLLNESVHEIHHSRRPLTLS